MDSGAGAYSGTLSARCVYASPFVLARHDQIGVIFTYACLLAVARCILLLASEIILLLQMSLFGCWMRS